jgi:hypothetical protein
VKLRSLVILAVFAGGAACASQGAASSGGARNLVTATELATAGDVHLYDALARVRPTMLQPRIGGGTTGVTAVPISVFFDGMQMMEGVQSLREIAAKNIAEVRFLEPQQASARFGGNQANGALVVTSKK